MKTFFATLLVVATAADSADTDVSLFACADGPTSALGCIDATYTTVDDNSTLHWKWMITSKSRTSFTTVINNYAYCNYLSIPFGEEGMQQSLANCGHVTSAGTTETVQTYVSSASATA